MNLGNGETLKNGLYISNDWLSFTLFEPCSLADVFSLLGYAESDFQLLPSGRNGYKSQLRHSVYPISVQYDGNEGMGIHVDISGSAIDDVLSHFCMTRLVQTPFDSTAYDTESFKYTVLVDLLSKISERGHVTRFDIPIDDIGANYFSLSELHDIFNKGMFVSKFRTFKELRETKTTCGVVGDTIYLGSRESELMIRIYDKQLEQKKTTGSLTAPWVRWELELKGDRAVSVVKLLLDGQSLEAVAIGILSNYLRLIENDNSRKSRCSMSEKWRSFIDGIAKVKLYFAEKVKTIKDTEEWLFRQVAPSLAAVLLHNEGDSSFIQDMLYSGRCRLKQHHLNMIYSG